MSENYITLSTSDGGLDVSIGYEDFERFKALLYTIFCGNANNLIFDLVYEILLNKEQDEQANQIKILQGLMRELKVKDSQPATQKPVIRPSSFR